MTRPAPGLGRARRQRRRHGQPHTPCPHPLQDSAVAFLLQLESGVKLQAHVYLCYDASPADAAAATAGGRARGPALAPDGQGYGW